MHIKNQDSHTPVLLEPVLHYLDPQTGESYLDLTAGYGGHAAAVLERTQTPGNATLVDRDLHAVDALSKRFGETVRIIHDDFLTASQKLAGEGIGFDTILADLGVSSPHLDNASRGFAIALDGPLDMRMDQRQPLTARDVVNTYALADLQNLLKTYGEEPKAARIATAIVAARPIATTQELAAVVATAAHPKRGAKTHPATRTFQALRIAVNVELRLIRESLPIWVSLLKPGGRLAIISFHSLEDRIVKQFLAEHGGNTYDAELTILTKRPVTAGQHELVSNPRARSAKLRAAAKIKNLPVQNSAGEERELKKDANSRQK
jgi:16S rRNA (cytosine1402-N4)-methyltransferase